MWVVDVEPDVNFGPPEFDQAIYISLGWSCPHSLASSWPVVLKLTSARPIQFSLLATQSLTEGRGNQEYRLPQGTLGQFLCLALSPGL